MTQAAFQGVLQTACKALYNEHSMLIAARATDHKLLLIQRYRYRAELEPVQN